MLALDPDDGKIKWHFQFTPHDTHDWDANETLVLFDAHGRRPRAQAARAGQSQRLLLRARSRDRRVPHRHAVREADVGGRPRREGPADREARASSRAPKARWCIPSIQGAANWYSPSYSPKTNLFYQAAREMGTIYYKGEAVYKPGIGFTGGGGRTLNGDDAWSAVRALDATTGKMKWEFKLLSPGWSSLLSTAGGLVFGGTEEGNFFALDAETRQAAVGHAARRQHPRHPDVVRGRRQAVRRHRRRVRAVRLRVAVAPRTGMRASRSSRSS